MIEEATVDAYGEAEEVGGWFAILESNVALPFETTVLGVRVRVVRIELRDHGLIAATCRHSRHSQEIALVDLPLPTPPPKGSEWIEAYCRWLAGE